MGMSIVPIASALAAAGESLPVRKVVLYKHGMGYFERGGKVSGDATISLSFRADQMKDLLTSFFAVDLGGGRIGAVQYETKDPLSKQLQDIRIEVPENAALSQFLAQLKGARITARAAGEKTSGRILGIEPVVQVVDGKSIQKGFRLVIMTDEGPVKSLDLFSISEFSLDDETLQRDLKRLLAISLDSKYTNRKKLTLSANGRGEREIRVGYLIETPIWKCSYRVIFDGKAKDAEAHLQGWALAENTTEDDWNDVEIAFVAGNPLSYVMDLYSPFYIRRPQVPIPGLDFLAANWGAAPEPSALPIDAEAKADRGLPMDEAEEDLAAAEEEGGLRRIEGAAESRIAASAPVATRMEPAAAAKPMGELLQSSVASVAKGVKVGEMFSYKGQEKVSIQKGRAAMVPILMQKVKGRKILYYKAAFSPKPANAYVLKNDTDLTLEAGAVTFFEEDTALGEGILSHTLPPGGQEIIPYAIDASVDVTPQVRSERQPYFKGVLADGILTLTCVESLINTWTIVNRGKSDVTLWFDQPRNAAYRLARPEKADDEVGDHYRFSVTVRAGERKEFLVEEKRDVYDAVHLSNSDENAIRYYAAQRYLSEGAKAFLKEVADLMAQRAAVQRELREMQEQSRRLEEEQRRLRENMASMRTDRPKEQELRAKWVEQLAAAEEKLTELRGKVDDAARRLRGLEETLARKIREYRDR
ncbi:MAG: DUF4139 domain-containing protein [Planctomycetota bacterium]|nr:DUF4139 domain-containing protein [Planctomycetota bacterium]